MSNKQNTISLSQELKTNIEKASQKHTNSQESNKIINTNKGNLLNNLFITLKRTFCLG